MLAGKLTIGLGGPLQIREERLSMREDACRLMYISDIHLRRGRSAGLSRQIIQSAQVSKMGAILLGGDLVDEGAELKNLAALVAGLSQLAPVLAVGGNHDRWVGMSRVRDAVIEGGGNWIHAGMARLNAKCGRVIAVCGPEAPRVPGGDVRVLCAHNPNIWKKTRNLGFDLVLAGHLHGCQCVAFEYRDRLFPGTLFYQQCRLRHYFQSSHLVVSRGVSDLVPIRWRCPREVVLCHV